MIDAFRMCVNDIWIDKLNTIDIRYADFAMHSCCNTGVESAHLSGE
mgnify:CR=1 FL=1